MTEKFWQDMNDDIQRFTEARVEVLEERIAKAKAILAHVNSGDYALCTCMLAIDNALEALEGK